MYTHQRQYISSAANFAFGDPFIMQTINNEITGRKNIITRQCNGIENGTVREFQNHTFQTILLAFPLGNFFKLLYEFIYELI